MIFFLIFLTTSLLLQLWFLDTVYRFREFLKDRENSFTFNLEGIFQTNSSVYSTAEELGCVPDSPNYNTLK